jgi:hypothetical protein
MSKAVDQYTPSRRYALRFAAFAAVSAALPIGAQATTTADAALLKACAEFEAIEATVQAWNAGRLSDADGEATLDLWRQKAVEIGRIEAKTAAGAKAKALVAMRQIPEHDAPDDITANVCAIIRDLATGAWI